MAVQEIARLLRIRAEEEREGLRRRYGADAAAVAEDISDLLAIRLQEESPNSALWEDFQRAPRDRLAELIGALEAIVEADPALARRMDAFLNEFHEAMQTSAAQEAGETERVVEAAPPEGAPNLPKPGTPAAREPYYPDTATQLDHESVAGDGTYLYGNVKGGQQEVGRSIGVDTFDFGERVRAVQLKNLSGVPTFFDELFSTFEEISDLPLNRKLEIQAALQELKEEIRRDEEADQERITQRLLMLRDKAPDVAEAVMQALEAIEMAPPVATAVKEARQAAS
ncbi:MAG: hypothetical protein ACP5JG_06100 [Anaerolineae bacterium]